LLLLYTKELDFSESPKRFGNHREEKLKSYYREFVIRFIYIIYLECLQYFTILILEYILRCVGVVGADFLLLSMKVLVVRGLTKNELLRKGKSSKIASWILNLI
jgi:hypothetical protein